MGVNVMATLCTYAATCPVFTTGLGPLPHLGIKYRRAYCRGGWSECARHLLADTVGSDSVPATLLPSQRNQIVEVVAHAVS